MAGGGVVRAETQLSATRHSLLSTLSQDVEQESRGRAAWRRPGVFSSAFCGRGARRCSGACFLDALVAAPSGVLDRDLVRVLATGLAVVRGGRAHRGCCFDRHDILPAAKGNCGLTHSVLRGRENAIAARERIEAVRVKPRKPCGEAADL